MSQESLWVIDDDRAMRWVLEKTFKEEGLNVTCFEEGQSALDALEQQPNVQPPDVIITDIRMPGMDGLTFLSHIKALHPNLPVIIMTAHSDLDSAVSSYQTGAFEYLPKPFDIDEALALVNRAIAHNASLKPSAQPDKSRAIAPRALDIIGESPAMQEVFRAIGRLSQSHITVLINGESGTGKELVAHALHRHSPRSSKPFIALNMAAIPKDLMETELFGHEKGAFTGANSQRHGRFEQANGGTLFLDEIGDMPFDTQTRLLRVLADGEFYRVGGHVPVKVDVRIIAATHQDLEKLVQDGRFREDLYHRLNVIRIHIPRLRDRSEDIPMLAAHFLARAGRELSVEPKYLLPEAITLLQQLPWPGNVRQLENTCRWLTVMASSREIFASDLPPELRQLSSHAATSTTAHSTTHSPAPQNQVPQNQVAQSLDVAANPAALTKEIGNPNAWESLLSQWAKQQLQQGEQQLLNTALPRFERIMIEAALAHSQGKKRLAAELLGWGRNTLTRKLRELGLSDGDDDDEMS